MDKGFNLNTIGEPLDKIRHSFNGKGHMIIFIILVMVVQSALLFYWSDQRGNYYQDELFSLEYAKIYPTDMYQYHIKQDPEFTHNEWIDNYQLKSHLIVEDAENMREMNKADVLHVLLIKRTFMGLLNLAVADADYFDGYTRAALILNMILFMISDVLIFLCMKTMTGSNKIAALCLIMFGFNAVTMGLCEYIRFYTMACTLMLACVFCHLKMWRTDNKLIFFILELFAFIFAYYGIMHSELLLVICGSFCCLYFLGLCIRRKFINAVIYAVPLLYGMHKYIDQRTDLLFMVFHPFEYAKPNSHGKEKVAYNLMTVTPERASECLKTITGYITDFWFGYGFLAICALCVLAIYLGLIIRRRKLHGKQPKALNLPGYGGFAFIVFLTALTGCVFNVLTDCYSMRYDSFFIVLAMMSLWYIVWSLNRRYPKKTLIIALAVITIAGVCTCQQADRYPMLYTEDKDDVAVIEEYSDLDSVLFGKAKRKDAEGNIIGEEDAEYDARKERVYENKALYDCVIHTGDDARFLAMNRVIEVPLMDKKPPKQFLAWCYEGGKEMMDADMKGAGYKVEKIASTVYNDVYLCTKK